MDKIAKREIVDEIENRLSGNRNDSILDSSYSEELNVIIEIRMKIVLYF